MHDRLLFYWRYLTTSYSSDAVLIDGLFSKIKKAYTEPHRRYHTLSHIENLLALFEMYKTELSDKEMVLFAIFYHDVIYQPGTADNEEQSARKAEKDLLKLKVPEEKREAVKTFILATKEHTLQKVKYEDDLKFFLDFDRSILGADEATYAVYVQAIRHEFSFLSDAAFVLGRSSFLKNTLSKGNLFYTVPFQQQYEAQAKRNMEQELRQWLRHT